MWISLAATGLADAYLRALQYRTVITDVALKELERGRTTGRRAADEVMALIHIGLVEEVSLAPDDELLFLSLVSGGAFETLDDGEAATLAWAASSGGLAIIDERKATAVAARRAPQVTLRSTADLMLAPQVVATLGEAAIAEALYAALTGALMRVPNHRLEEVAALLGPERTQACRSLPASIRIRRVDQDLDAGLSLETGEI